MSANLIASNNSDTGGWEAIERGRGQWFVVHTKSRQEKALAQALEAMGVAYFLPLVKRASVYGRRKVTKELPLFPGYLFLRGELDEAYLADRTKRIAHIIHAGDQDRLREELRNIWLVLTKEAELNPYPFLKNGIRVEVRSGPFQGIQGVIENRAKKDRLILQVEALGQATSLEIEAGVVEPL